MTASHLSIVLVAFALGVAIAVTVLVIRRPASDTASVPDQRPALWVLLLVATVPLAVFTTMAGAGILAILIDRCSLWGCYPKRSVSELDLSLPTVGLGLGLCAIIFAVWWLALLPSPLPRKVTARRTVRLLVASVATLFAAGHAVFGIG